MFACLFLIFSHNLRVYICVFKLVILALFCCYLVDFTFFLIVLCLSSIVQSYLFFIIVPSPLSSLSSLISSDSKVLLS